MVAIGFTAMVSTGLLGGFFIHVLLNLQCKYTEDNS